MYESLIADIEAHVRATLACLIEEQQVPGSQLLGRKSTRLSALPAGRTRNARTGAGITVLNQATAVEATWGIPSVAIGGTDELQCLLRGVVTDGHRIRRFSLHRC